MVDGWGLWIQIWYYFNKDMGFKSRGRAMGFDIVWSSNWDLGFGDRNKTWVYKGFDRGEGWDWA